MANKDRKHKLNKQNKQRDNSKHELDRDLHFINQREGKRPKQKKELLSKSQAHGKC